MENQIELAGRLGHLEGAITSLKDRNQEVNRILENLSDRVIQAQVDLEGTVEQLRGHLSTISDMEIELRRLEEGVDALKHDRMLAWERHDHKCERCAERFANIIRQTIEDHHGKVENLGLIALIKRFWWQSILIAIGISAFLNVDTIFIERLIKYLTH